jgi:hypothetical protein
MTTGSGPVTGVLTFSKCTSMTLSLTAAGGQVIATTGGASGLSISATVAAGSYAFTAVGDGHCTFKVTASYPS